MDHGRLTENPWWPHGITEIVSEAATDFAPMQVDETHIPHTDPRFNDRVDSYYGVQDIMNRTTFLYKLNNLLTPDNTLPPIPTNP